MSLRILPHYTDLQIGVAVDLVNAVEEITCQRCGEQAVSFPDFNGLLAAIAVFRVTTPRTLQGEEIRFLRKVLALTAKEFAAHLGMREETISRWENKREHISPAAEQRLRVFVATTLAERIPGIPVNRDTSPRDRDGHAPRDDAPQRGEVVPPPAPPPPATRPRRGWVKAINGGMPLPLPKKKGDQT